MMNEKGKIGKTEFSVVVDIIRSDLVENYMEEYDFARTFVQIVDEMPNPDDLSDDFYSFLKDMCWRNLTNMNAHIKLQYERTENMYKTFEGIKKNYPWLWKRIVKIVKELDEAET